MTEQDNLLHELESALQVEPSKRLADGVRRRISAARLRRRVGWMGLAAAGVVIGAFSVWPDVATVQPGPAIAAIAKAPEASSSTTVQAPAPVRFQHEGRLASEASGASRSPALEPPLEVITNQGALLRQMWREWKAGAVPSIAVGDVPAVVSEFPTLVVEPISVAPIVVDEIIIRREVSAQEQK